MHIQLWQDCVRAVVNALRRYGLVIIAVHKYHCVGGCLIVSLYCYIGRYALITVVPSYKGVSLMLRRFWRRCAAAPAYGFRFKGLVGHSVYKGNRVFLRCVRRTGGLRRCSIMLSWKNHFAAAGIYIVSWNGCGLIINQPRAIGYSEVKRNLAGSVRSGGKVEFHTSFIVIIVHSVYYRNGKGSWVCIVYNCQAYRIAVALVSKPAGVICNRKRSGAETRYCNWDRYRFARVSIDHRKRNGKVSVGKRRDWHGKYKH